MIEGMDPALAGMIAFVTGLFTLAMLMEAVRALIWVFVIIWVAKRMGLYVVRDARRRDRW